MSLCRYTRHVMSMSDERKTRDQTPAGRSTAAGSGSSTPRDEAKKPRSSSSASSTAEPAAASVPDRLPVSGSSATETSKAETAQAIPEDGVYFFPDRVVGEAEVRKLLASDSKQDRAEVVSRLLTYAEYDEIWTWVDRVTVRELFDDLDLPDRLRAAWGRNLGLVAKTG